MQKLSGWWCIGICLLIISCTKTNITPQPSNHNPSVIINSFQASAANGKVLIQFSTTNENNIKYFEIFSGQTGNQLCIITTMLPQISPANQTKTYSFEDIDPKGNPTYYMLGYVGNDNTVKYDAQLLTVSVPGK